MSKEETALKIEQYLKGQLTDEETKQLEAIIEANPELAKEVEVYRIEFEVMNTLVEDELTTQMEGWYEELKAEKQPSNSSPQLTPIRLNRQKWSIAAAIVLITTIGIWFLLDGPSKLDQKDSTQADTLFKIGLQVEDGLGFAGPSGIIDSITIKVFKDLQNTRHYRFKEETILELYFHPDYQFDRTTISLIELPQGLYRLTIGNQQDTIRNGYNNIYPLKNSD